jgi:hypothetical protein
MGRASNIPEFAGFRRGDFEAFSSLGCFFPLTGNIAQSFETLRPMLGLETLGNKNSNDGEHFTRRMKT